MVTSASAQSPQKEQLLNGLKVLMWPDAKADKVSVRIRVHAGSAFDPAGKEGVMQLLADNLFPNPAAKEFFTDDLGGSLDVITTYDYIQVNASSKPDGLLQMLETLSTAVSNPLIEKDQTNNLRNVLLAKVRELESDPGYVADHAAAKRLLGTYPYGRPQFGTPASLQKIDHVDLIDAKMRLLTADNATMTISGNFDRALAFRAIRRYFGSWLKSDKKSPTTFRNPDDPPQGVLIIPSPKPDSAAIAFALRGTARNSPDFAAAGVYSFIVRQRLEASVPHDKAGQISVINEAHVLPGIFYIDLGNVKDASPVKSIPLSANEIVAKALGDPITDAEFERSRSDAQAVWSRVAAEDLWLDVDTFKTTGADNDRNVLARVTAADVRAFADKLRRSPIVTVVVSGTGADK